MSTRRERLMVVVDYVGHCPICGVVQYASEALADELCQDCRMGILRGKLWTGNEWVKA